MEVPIVSKPTPSSGSQTTQQPNTTANAENNASGKTLQANPASVVTVAPETESVSAQRRQDRLAKQQDESVSAQKAIESLRLTNRRTQLNFDTELNTVFLQVIDVRTEEVVETIPPEELVRQLKVKADPPAPHTAEEPVGGVVIDESV